MKVGIIGLGYRMEYLARVLKSRVSDFRLVGFVDPNPAGLAGLTAHGISCGPAYADVESLVRASQPDLIMIGTPNHLHLSHLKAALACDVKIFCEKPVVISESETFQLLELLSRTGTDRVMVGLVLRYAPLYADLRAAIAEGAIGGIVSIEACEHLAPFHGAFFMRDWRRYQRFCGSFILEKCCHDLDLYQGAVGARALKVASFGGRKSFLPENAAPAHREIYHRKPSGWGGSDKVFDSDADIIDHQVAIVEYENGAAMTFHTNINTPDESRHFCIIGSKGMAEGDFARNYFRLTDARTGDRLCDKTYAQSDLSAHYGADEQMIDDIVAHLQTGARLPVSIINALEAGLTAIKIDEARRNHAIIDLTESWAQFDAALSGQGKVSQQSD